MQRQAGRASPSRRPQAASQSARFARALTLGALGAAYLLLLGRGDQPLHRHAHVAALVHVHAAVHLALGPLHDGHHHPPVVPHLGRDVPARAARSAAPTTPPAPAPTTATASTATATAATALHASRLVRRRRPPRWLAPVARRDPQLRTRPAAAPAPSPPAPPATAPPSMPLPFTRGQLPVRRVGRRGRREVGPALRRALHPAHVVTATAAAPPAPPPAAPAAPAARPRLVAPVGRIVQRGRVVVSGREVLAGSTHHRLQLVDELPLDAPAGQEAQARLIRTSSPLQLQAALPGRRSPTAPSPVRPLVAVALPGRHVLALARRARPAPAPAAPPAATVATPAAASTEAFRGVRCGGDRTPEVSCRRVRARARYQIEVFRRVSQPAHPPWRAEAPRHAGGVLEGPRASALAGRRGKLVASSKKGPAGRVSHSKPAPWEDPVARRNTSASRLAEAGGRAGRGGSAGPRPISRSRSTRPHPSQISSSSMKWINARRLEQPGTLPGATSTRKHWDPALAGDPDLTCVSPELVAHRCTQPPLADARRPGNRPLTGPFAPGAQKRGRQWQTSSISAVEPDGLRRGGIGPPG